MATTKQQPAAAADAEPSGESKAKPADVAKAFEAFQRGELRWNDYLAVLHGTD